MILLPIVLSLPLSPASAFPSTERKNGRGIDAERLQLDVDVTQEVDVRERGKGMTPFTVFCGWTRRSGAGGASSSSGQRWM
jgi:hypothetical protein